MCCVLLFKHVDSCLKLEAQCYKGILSTCCTSNHWNITLPDLFSGLMLINNFSNWSRSLYVNSNERLKPHFSQITLIFNAWIHQKLLPSSNICVRPPCFCLYEVKVGESRNKSCYTSPTCSDMRRHSGEFSHFPVYFPTPHECTIIQPRQSLSQAVLNAHLSFELACWMLTCSPWHHADV